MNDVAALRESSSISRDESTRDAAHFRDIRRSYEIRDVTWGTRSREIQVIRGTLRQTFHAPSIAFSCTRACTQDARCVSALDMDFKQRYWIIRFSNA